MQKSNNKQVSVLMVCLGNICRSPLAEGILKQKLGTAGIAAKVDSAGTGDWHIGSAPHPDSQKVAKLNGINISDQRARQLQPTDFEHYDLIVFMDRENKKDGKKIAGTYWQEGKARLLLDSIPHTNLQDVPDPYFGGWDGFPIVYQLIDEACEALVEELSAFESR
jgi:protein-tyrosine phosphatase